eukprot:5547897-Heterocapsa_arctica.AAC.1
MPRAATHGVHAPPAVGHGEVDGPGRAPARSSLPKFGTLLQEACAWPGGRQPGVADFGPAPGDQEVSTAALPFQAGDGGLPRGAASAAT